MYLQAVPLVLSVSILIQLASAVTALLLVRASGFYKPWIFIAAAISLMVVRRITSLKIMLSSGVIPASSLGPELIALFISILMLTGLILFRPMFKAIKAAQKKSNEKIAEKEVQVRESHHHMKNDLQMIAAMVRLQQDYLPEGPALSFFKDLESRLHSFSLLHEYIYSGGDPNDSIAEYIRLLTVRIESVYSSANPSVVIRLELSDFSADRKEMLNCGLLLNEAITNAYKYAFPPGTLTSPVITVTAGTEDGKRVVTVRDNGVGLPDSGTSPGTTFGLILIRSIGETPGWSTSVSSPARPGDEARKYPGTLVVMEF
jgi:two-component sensor histidine kinase